MTPYEFERRYTAQWSELEALLESRRTGLPLASGTRPAHPAQRTVELYHRACQQLAVVRSRRYPQYLLERLMRLTQLGHQQIYQSPRFAWRHVLRIVLTDFPRQVRRLRVYVLIALLVFLIPALLMGMLTARMPELIYALLDGSMVNAFDQMYGPDAESIGRLRTAQNDWVMLGYYVNHNMTIAIQCFAGGIAVGVGSLFYLAWNGAVIGAVAGYLTQRGFGSTFYPFVVTHSAFELTAIVFSGAAGLRIGHALLAPGRQRRLQALTQAAREAVVLVYGALALLLVAAVIEAFWSSAPWIPLPLKYAVAAACWLGMISWLLWQDRSAR
jgi:uncharacterized membrane protein SpoIIM required for sporulation